MPDKPSISERTLWYKHLSEPQDTEGEYYSGLLEDQFIAWKGRHALFDSLGIDSPHGLFHYTSLDTAWKILEGQEMWASHARFSNDQLEVSAGIRALFGERQEKTDRKDFLIYHNYIICFCDDGDLLSMWRGYADGGVSLGMDFRAPDFFTVVHHIHHYSEDPTAHPTTAPACSMNRTLGRDQANDGPDPFVARPGAVLYHRGGKFTTWNQKELEEKSASIVTDMITEEVSKQLSRNPYTDVEDGSEYASELIRGDLVPYVKDAGFIEEREVRLVFELGDESQVVFYDQLGGNGVKRPKIHVRYGNGRWMPEKCEYIALPGILKPEIDTWKVELDEELVSDRIIFLDYPEEENSIYVGPMRDDEKQRQLVTQLRSLASRSGEYKVWSDSKWPIRTIKVGPRRDQEEVVEAMKHYCTNHWWLKDVEVSGSETPYRSSTSGGPVL